MTNFQATPSPNRNPVAKAYQEMAPNERMQWDTYIVDPCLQFFPSINWFTDIDPEPTSKKPLKNASRRAQALNRLFDTDQARPGHAVWYTKQHPDFLPLVKAVARVFGAERDIDGGGPEGMVKAELQTINTILGVLGEVAKEGKEKVDGMVIARTNSLLGAKRRTLRALSS
ncbi:MAG: hypothetical protein Q9210_005436 [Variospora velana]